MLLLIMVDNVDLLVVTWSQWVNPQIYIYDCSINKYNLDRYLPFWSLPCHTQTSPALEQYSFMVCLGLHRDNSWRCHINLDIISWQSTYEVLIYRLLGIYITHHVLDTLVTKKGASLLSCRKHVRTWLHQSTQLTINYNNKKNIKSSSFYLLNQLVARQWW